MHVCSLDEIHILAQVFPQEPEVGFGDGDFLTLRLSFCHGITSRNLGWQHAPQHLRGPARPRESDWRMIGCDARSPSIRRQ